MLETVDKGYIDLDVPRWQCLFASPLKTVPKVKVSCLNLDDVEGGEAPNKFFRQDITASKKFKKIYGFSSGVWREQKLQVVNEMRAAFADPRLSQEEKAKFGKRQIDRIKAAFEEAHRADVTEERVVYARCELNETTPHGGKATIGAPRV